MTLETFEQSGPGPYEVVEPDKPYRAVILDSGAAGPVTLTVRSGTATGTMTITLQPGEMRTGSVTVTGGNTPDCHGYLP